MRSLVTHALENHYRGLQIACGVDAVYRPAASAVAFEIRLIPGETLQQEIAVDDEEVSARYQDWLTPAAGFVDLVGRPPETGDEIDLVEHNQKTTFRVVPADEGRPYRFASHHRVAFRIHSVEVEAHE